MKKIISNIPPIISTTLTKVQYMLAIFRNIQADLISTEQNNEHDLESF